MSQETASRRPRSRTENFVDLIFGLSLSVGAIALITSTPPAGQAALNDHIIAFIFSFSFLITTWMVYTYQLSVLPVETKMVTFLNVIMLTLVALTPYLLNNVEYLGQSSIPEYASILFAFDLAGMLAILATFSHVISTEENDLVEPQIARIFRQSRNVKLILCALSIISIAPIFWTITFLTIPLRIYFWLIPIIVYWVRRYRQP